MKGLLFDNKSDLALVYIDTAYLVKFYFTVSIMPFGILLNVISLIIFSNERFHKNNSLGLLYIALCSFNIIALGTETIFASLDQAEIDVTSKSLFSCRLFSFWRMSVFHVPSFMQVLISLSVLLKIKFPNKKVLTENRFILLLIAFVVLFVFVTNSVYFSFFIEQDVFYDVISINNSNQTSQNVTTVENFCTTDRITDFAMDFVNLFMRDLLPFILIFILNIFSIRLLVFSKKNAHVKSLKHEFQFGRSIIAANILFLIIYSPWSILFVIFHIQHYTNLLHFTNELGYLKIIVNIFDCVGYLNNISTFFINFIFNLAFRSIFLNKIGLSKAKVSTISDKSHTKT